MLTTCRLHVFLARLSLGVKKADKENLNSPDRQLTWTILLAKWTQFAKSSLKLPKTAEGDRWRTAVAPIISLQAVTSAMAELDELEFDERALAFDKSEIIVRSRAEELKTLWAGEELPEAIVEIIDDTKLAIECAREGGLEWRLLQDRILVIHPGELVALLRSRGFKGDLFLPTPGIPMFSGSPIAFMRGRLGEPVEENHVMLVDEYLNAETDIQWQPGLRQVFRQFDFLKGGAARDLVQNSSTGVLPGQLLMVQALDDGEPTPVNMPPKKSKVDPVPVVFEVDEDEVEESD